MLVRRAFTDHCSGLGLETMLVIWGLAQITRRHLLRCGWATPSLARK